MTSNIPIGYCEHCKQNVLLIRQKIDVWLAIILLFFTVGIGLIIYLLINYLKPRNTCIHCGAIVTSFLDNRTQAPNQITYTPTTPQETELVQMIKGEEIHYCPLCGAQLDEKELNYCASCGSKI